MNLILIMRNIWRYLGLIKNKRTIKYNSKKIGNKKRINKNLKKIYKKNHTVKEVSDDSKTEDTVSAWSSLSNKCKLS